MKYKDEQGNWISIAMPSFDGIPIGTIVEYAGSVLPKGYLFCDGTSISRTDYADLFNKIGTAYGIGDGSTTFNLPNFKGRIPVGYDVAQEEFNELGKIGGSKELQSHTHLLKMAGDSNIGGNAPFADYHYIIQSPNINTYTNGWVSNSGNGNSGNIQPYQVVNYIIKAKQTTPTSAQIIDEYGTSTTDGYSQKYLNDKIDGYVLYENSSGTTSNILIENDQLSNYKYIDIYNQLCVFRVFKTGLNTCSVTVFSDTLYQSYIEYNITNSQNNLSIAISRSGTYFMNDNHPETFKTYKVIGYK